MSFDRQATLNLAAFWIDVVQLSDRHPRTTAVIGYLRPVHRQCRESAFPWFRGGCRLCPERSDQLHGIGRLYRRLNIAIIRTAPAPGGERACRRRSERPVARGGAAVQLRIGRGYRPAGGVGRTLRPCRFFPPVRPSIRRSAIPRLSKVDGYGLVNLQAGVRRRTGGGTCPSGPGTCSTRIISRCSPRPIPVWSPV